MAEDQNLIGIRGAVPSAGSPGTSVQVLESHSSSSFLSIVFVIPFCLSNKQKSLNAEERRSRAVDVLFFFRFRRHELFEANKPARLLYCQSRWERRGRNSRATIV